MPTIAPAPGDDKERPPLWEALYIVLQGASAPIRRSSGIRGAVWRWRGCWTACGVGVPLLLQPLPNRLHNPGVDTLTGGSLQICRDKSTAAVGPDADHIFAVCFGLIPGAAGCVLAVACGLIYHCTTSNRIIHYNAQRFIMQNTQKDKKIIVHNFLRNGLTLA